MELKKSHNIFIGGPSQPTPTVSNTLTSRGFTFPKQNLGFMTTSNF